MTTGIERQRKFKEKMYESGFKQTAVWIKRKEVKYIKNLKRIDFIKRLEKITFGWHDKDLSEFYNLVIKIAAAKKEVIKLRQKE